MAYKITKHVMEALGLALEDMGFALEDMEEKGEELRKAKTELIECKKTIKSMREIEKAHARLIDELDKENKELKAEISDRSISEKFIKPNNKGGCDG
jgi:hypothetical protein